MLGAYAGSAMLSEVPKPTYLRLATSRISKDDNVGDARAKDDWTTSEYFVAFHSLLTREGQETEIHGEKT